jgi:hypothetical protein
MDLEIRTLTEKKRGCGYRKPGGMYLISGKPSAPCGKLPLPLTVCPTCNQGIKPARGWTTINGAKLVADVICSTAHPRPAFEPHVCAGCPMHLSEEKVGLL